MKSSSTSSQVPLETKDEKKSEELSAIKSYQEFFRSYIELLKESNSKRTIYASQVEEEIDDLYAATVQKINTIINHEYELELMTSLPDHKEDKAQAGKIYVSPNGDYVVLNLKGAVCRGSLKDKNIDLTNLKDRLLDEQLTNAILEVTSKAGHTIKKESATSCTFEDMKLINDFTLESVFQIQDCINNRLEKNLDGIVLSHDEVKLITEYEKLSELKRLNDPDSLKKLKLTEEEKKRIGDTFTQLSKDQLQFLKDNEQRYNTLRNSGLPPDEVEFIKVNSRHKLELLKMAIKAYKAAKLERHPTLGAAAFAEYKLVKIDEKAQLNELKKVYSNFDPIYGYEKEYTLELMTSLPSNKESNARLGKIYVSPNGDYVVRDLKGDVRKGSLNDAKVDLTNLQNRLQDKNLMLDILQVTSKASLTKKIDNQLFKTQFDALWKQYEDIATDLGCVSDEIKRKIGNIKQNLFDEKYSGNQSNLYFNDVKKLIEDMYMLFIDKDIDKEKRKSCFVNLIDECQYCSPMLPTYLGKAKALLEASNTLTYWIASMVDESCDWLAMTYNEFYSVSLGNSSHTNNAFYQRAAENGWYPLSKTKNANDPFIKTVGLDTQNGTLYQVKEAESRLEDFDRNFDRLMTSSRIMDRVTTHFIDSYKETCEVKHADGYISSEKMKQVQQLLDNAELKEMSSDFFDLSDDYTEMKFNKVKFSFRLLEFFINKSFFKKSDDVLCIFQENLSSIPEKARFEFLKDHKSIREMYIKQMDTQQDFTWYLLCLIDSDHRLALTILESENIKKLIKTVDKLVLLCSYFKNKEEKCKLLLAFGIEFVRSKVSSADNLRSLISGIGLDALLSSEILDIQFILSKSQNLAQLVSSGIKHDDSVKLIKLLSSDELKKNIVTLSDLSKVINTLFPEERIDFLKMLGAQHVQKLITSKDELLKFIKQFGYSCLVTKSNVISIDFILKHITQVTDVVNFVNGLSKDEVKDLVNRNPGFIEHASNIVLNNKDDYHGCNIYLMADPGGKDYLGSNKSDLYLYNSFHGQVREPFYFFNGSRYFFEEEKKSSGLFNNASFNSSENNLIKCTNEKVIKSVLSVAAGRDHAHFTSDLNKLLPKELFDPLCEYINKNSKKENLVHRYRYYQISPWVDRVNLSSSSIQELLAINESKEANPERYYFYSWYFKKILNVEAKEYLQRVTGKDKDSFTKLSIAATKTIEDFVNLFQLLNYARVENNYAYNTRNEGYDADQRLNLAMSILRGQNGGSIRESITIKNLANLASLFPGDRYRTTKLLEAVLFDSSEMQAKLFKKFEDVKTAAESLSQYNIDLYSSMKPEILKNLIQSVDHLKSIPKSAFEYYGSKLFNVKLVSVSLEECKRDKGSHLANLLKNYIKTDYDRLLFITQDAKKIFEILDESNKNKNNKEGFFTYIKNCSGDQGTLFSEGVIRGSELRDDLVKMIRSPEDLLSAFKESTYLAEYMVSHIMVPTKYITSSKMLADMLKCVSNEDYREALFKLLDHNLINKLIITADDFNNVRSYVKPESLKSVLTSDKIKEIYKTATSLNDIQSLVDSNETNCSTAFIHKLGLAAAINIAKSSQSMMSEIKQGLPSSKRALFSTLYVKKMQVEAKVVSQEDYLCMPELMTEQEFKDASAIKRAHRYQLLKDIDKALKIFHENFNNEKGDKEKCREQLKKIDDTITEIFQKRPKTDRRAALESLQSVAKEMIKYWDVYIAQSSEKTSITLKK